MGWHHDKASGQVVEFKPIAIAPQHQRVILRSVFQRGFRIDARDDNVVVELRDNEWIVNVETIPPNPTTGVGVRVWIGSLA